MEVLSVYLIDSGRSSHRWEVCSWRGSEHLHTDDGLSIALLLLLSSSPWAVPGSPGTLIPTLELVVAGLVQGMEEEYYFPF